MRSTVLVSEYLIYVPAAVIFLRRFSRLHGVHTWEASIALMALLMQPSTTLIDHAHFQYNTVMLGFVLASMSSMLAGRRLWASVFFVAALGFKQMALYYAPAVFAYLLGVCTFPRIEIVRLATIAVVTVISFLMLFTPLFLGSLYDAHRGISPDPAAKSPPALLPIFSALPIRFNTSSWYYPPLLQLSQSIHRIFPFARGLFEDKVANVWCSLDVLIKLRQFSPTFLQRLSLLATLAAIIPPCSIIFFKPKKQLLPLAFAATAWAFFLCSFQVHEKSVLLPLLPMTVQLASNGGLTPATRAWVGWANALAIWTMYPLLQRDGLRVPYVILALLWAYLLGLPPTSLAAYFGHKQGGEGRLSWGAKALHLLFYAVMITWHGAEAWVTPPDDKPDLWVVANVGVGCAGFGICYLWCLWRLVTESGLWKGQRRSIMKGKEKTL
jgi:alpha-1,3-glucosyltransferase